MLSDIELSILLDALGEDVQIVDSSDQVLATVRGAFKRRTGQIDFGGPNYSEVPYEGTTEQVTLDVRTIDVTGDWVGQFVLLKNGAYQHREGASHAPKYTIVDRRDDAQGITQYILDR